jgi:hypothetical protein
LIRQHQYAPTGTKIRKSSRLLLSLSLLSQECWQDCYAALTDVDRRWRSFYYPRDSVWMEARLRAFCMKNWAE